MLWNLLQPEHVHELNRTLKLIKTRSESILAVVFGSRKDLTMLHRRLKPETNIDNEHIVQWPSTHTIKAARDLNCWSSSTPGVNITSKITHSLTIYIFSFDFEQHVRLAHPRWWCHIKIRKHLILGICDALTYM